MHDDLVVEYLLLILSVKELLAIALAFACHYRPRLSPLQSPLYHHHQLLKPRHSLPKYGLVDLEGRYLHRLDHAIHMLLTEFAHCGVLLKSPTDEVLECDLVDFVAHYTV